MCSVSYDQIHVVVFFLSCLWTLSVNTTYVSVVDKSKTAHTKRTRTPESGGHGSLIDSTSLLTERSYPNGISKQHNRHRSNDPDASMDANKAITRPSSRIKCVKCELNGQTYKGHSRFEYRDGCLHYRCICHCDGTHTCPEGSVTDMCERESRQNPNCKSCNVQDKTINGNSYFDMKDGCTLYKNCACRCNGSFECSDQRSENLCRPTGLPATTSTSSTKSLVDNICRNCFAHGRQQKGNSRFTRVDDCIEYDCDCFCNGEWACPAERAHNICDFDDETPSVCSECELNGEFFEGNSKFKRTTGCIEYTCNCHCDGTYDCPADLIKDVCKIDPSETCSKCAVSETESYLGDSDFTIKKECIHYNCRCNCDGSWNCPGKDARNICRGEKPGGCRNCEVSEKEYYPGDSNFTLTKKCIGYTCRCNCDGSWDCPGEDARDTCKGEVIGGCKSCTLSDREYYPGETDFEMKRGCILYQCRCKCDGGWECPGYKAKDICKNPEISETGRRKRCSTCELSNGENHQPNSKFKLARGCYVYQCTCDCDGTHDCPPDTAVNICDVSPNDEQKFKEQQERELRRQRLREQEKMREQQQREAYERQRKREQDIRQARQRLTIERADKERLRQQHAGERLRVRTKQGRLQQIRRQNENQVRREQVHESSGVSGRRHTVDQDTVQQARRQQVKNDQTRKQQVHGNSRLTEGRHNVEHTEYTQPCLKCSFAGKTHPGNTQFEYKRGCYLYQCSCDCNGRWKCDRDNVIYTCNKTHSTVRRVHVQTDNRNNESVTYRVHANYTNSVNSHSVNRRPQPDSSITRSQLPGHQSYAVHTDSSLKVGAGYRYQTGNTVRVLQSTNNRFVVQTPQQVNPFIRNGLKHEVPVPAYGNIPTSAETNYYPFPHTAGLNTHTSSTKKFVFPVAHNMGSRQIQSRRQSTHPIPSTPYIPAPHAAYPPSSVSSEKTGSCQACVADGKYYNVNDVFDMNRNCVIYKCRCMCNGNYRCAITPNPICSVRSVQDQCGNCHVGGLIYPGNMGFQERKGCHEYTCQCKCDGTYDCPEDKKVNLCPSNEPASHSAHQIQSDCAVCDIEGQTYTGNTRFKIYEKCLVYNCECDCNGLWKCSGEHAPGCLSAASAVTVGYPDIRKTTSCSKCLLNDASYSPNANFTLTQGCLEYLCLCNCDGSWYCPSQSPNQVCDARVMQRKSSSCQSCDVRGTVYPADATFVLREGCHQHTCTCNCDGTWRCPVNTTINVCETSPTDGGNSVDVAPGCKSCTVNGKTYLSNSGFKFREGCTQHNCKCFCNGTWECPTEKIENTCRSSDYRIDGCKECLVKNKTYPGGSTFSYREGCWEFNCMCSCEGRWNCPAGRSFDLCETAGSVSSRCRPCIIQSKTIMSKSSFNLRQGCNEYLCDCGCDGNWTCPEERSINTCELEGEAGMSPSETVVKGCTIGDKTYFRRIFGYTENCVEYTCICFDNGAWRCPPNRSKKVC